jgi:AraC-like DNA-binding protein
MTTPPTRRRRRAAESFFRYLPVSESSREWGFYVFNVGYSRVPPGSPYPCSRHPADHYFTWHKGRTLHSMAFVYITRGQGEFESLPSGRLPIREGSLIVLFPGVWHRYVPDRRTGWDEHWMEFDGDCARRFFQRKEFRPEKPILEVGFNRPLLDLFALLAETSREESYGFEYLLAGFGLQIVANVLVAVGGRKFDGGQAEPTIARAKGMLLGNLADNVDLPAMAQELGVSYTWFRRAFKEYTGFSPRQFQLHHRLQRACEMLTSSATPVGEIAQLLGFESVYYFSQLFKKKLGCSPLKFRRAAAAPGHRGRGR